METNPAMFEVKGEFNTACHCHPEYHQIEVSASTFAEAAKQLVASEKFVTTEYINSLIPNVEVVVRRPLTTQERQEFVQEVVKAREIEIAKIQTKLDAEKKKKLLDKLREDYMRGKADLTKNQKDLVPAAIIRRGEELQVLRLKIEELGGKVN